MNARTPFVLLMAFLFSALVAIGGCTQSAAKKDPKAAAACATSAKTSAACKTCCRGAGAMGHMYIATKGCSCL